jgi:DMSO/TMAO reductase YedYZ molybdopterin-dependent catalytic subunit
MTATNDDKPPVWRPETADEPLPGAGITAGAAPRSNDRGDAPPASAGPDRGDADPGAPTDPGRRRLILGGLGLLAGAALAGGAGKLLLDRLATGAGAVASPTPAGPPPSPILAGVTAAPLAAGEQLSAPGLTPLVTPADQFFRIDSAQEIPVIDAATWRLKITGMVDRPRTYSYTDLAAMPLIEQYVTLACVSNSVGGNLIGNALWTGARLKVILAAAGIQPGATQIVGRSVDGFTVGFPTSWALDPGREPMVVLGMNHEPLTPEHGYPARLIVPGLYGYVSATKWLSEIELTTREAFDAYWVQLGWDKDAPVLTEARIDNPGYLSKFPSGPTWIDGMAWAPDRGISRVEVRIDDGPWNVAETSRAVSKATWVQWMWLWQANPGEHTIRVRATDGTGAIQTDIQAMPAPNGATGYPSIQVTVT